MNNQIPSNATNRITTSGYQYDVNGNMTRSLADDGVTWVKYEYDSANRLWWVKKDDGTQLQRFGYGATNARFQSFDAQANQWTLYAAAGGTALAEYTEFTANTPTWTKSYTYLGDSQLATITPNGSGGEIIDYDHPDRLGTKTVTNQQSGTASEQAHLPFGRPLDAESTQIGNNKRFTSYDRSSITKLDYAVNRTYDSKLARFNQVDPIGMGSVSLAAPQTLNLYAYCGNDPVNYTDANGLFFGSLFKWIGKIFSAFQKILKWVVIAVVVIAVAIAIFHSGGAAIGFLKVILGIVGKLLGLSVHTTPLILNLAAGTITGGTIASISIGLSGQIIAGAYAVGAIASEYADGKRKKKPKRRPGLFQTVDQAARWWLKIANPQSIAINREIAVPICERTNDGAIIFGPFDIGTKDSSTVKNCPSETKRVGSAHTHAAYDPAYDNENFSPADRRNANNRSLADGGSTPNYLATPAGAMRKFKPSAIKDSIRGKPITLKPL